MNEFTKQLTDGLNMNTSTACLLAFTLPVLILTTFIIARIREAKKRKFNQ